MTTAVISDLHLGTVSERDLLRDEAVLATLTGALADVDELVLLGDVIELRESPVSDALAAALPVLERIGAALAGRRVTIVPGNHDHQLAEPLIERLRLRSRPLGVETLAKPSRSGLLGAVTRALAPAEVRIAYPGVWLRDDVFATHGHYLDVHNTVPSFERLAIGAVQRVVGEVAPEGSLAPADYEAAVGPVYAMSYAIAQASRGRRVASAQSSMRAWRLINGAGSSGLLGRVPGLVIGGLAVPGAVAALNRIGLGGQLKSDLSGPELRRAALAGMAQAIERLGIEAEHVVFGHTHRSGPQERDAAEEWSLPGGGRLLNTGSWIHEPAFLGDPPHESPYWPGHLALVPESGPPELHSLLDRLPAARAPAGASGPAAES